MENEVKGPPAQSQSKPGDSAPDQVLNTFFTEFESWTKDPKPEGVEALKGHVTKYREASEAARKAAEAGKPAIPEKYNLTLPKDSLLDGEYVKGLEAMAKERKMTQADLDGVLKRDHELIGTLFKKQADTLKANDETWLKELQNDKEFGGDKFGENSEKAKRFWAAVVEDQKLRDEIAATGLMNYPPLVKAFVAAHKKFGIGEDQAPGTGAGGGQKLSDGDVIYGKK